MRTGFLALLAALLASGCASFSPPHTPGFETLAADPRILYEPGATPLAERVAIYLPQAIQDVEQAHYRSFTQPVSVHVCGSETCFAQHVVSQNVSGATVPDNQVYLSPRLFDSEAERLPRILTHELSHLLLGQQIGHFTYRVPVWFHEGLAAYASHGGGADYASEAEARDALRHGHAFNPAQLDDEAERHRADFWHLSPYLFYREEAMMFVQYLKHNEAQFRQFLEGVEDKEDFAQAFGNAYNMTLDEAGQHFIQSFNLDAAAPSAPTQ